MADILEIKIGSGCHVCLICPVENSAGQFSLSDILLVNSNFLFTILAKTVFFLFR